MALVAEGEVVSAAVVAVSEEVSVAAVALEVEAVPSVPPRPARVSSQVAVALGTGTAAAAAAALAIAALAVLARTTAGAKEPCLDEAERYIDDDKNTLSFPLISGQLRSIHQNKFIKEI